MRAGNVRPLFGVQLWRGQPQATGRSTPSMLEKCPLQVWGCCTSKAHDTTLGSRKASSFQGTAQDVTPRPLPFRCDVFALYSRSFPLPVELLATCFNHSGRGIYLFSSGASSSGVVEIMLAVGSTVPQAPAPLLHGPKPMSGKRRRRALLGLRKAASGKCSARPQSKPGYG